MISDLRWLGLASTVIAVVAAGVPLLGKPLDWQNSVSYSWTGSRRKFLILAVVMSFAGAGMCAGWIEWIIPHYHLPALIYGVVAIAYIALMGVAWVPMTDKPGDHSYLHPHFVGGAALATLAIVAMASVAWFGVNVPVAARVLSFSAMILAACWPLLFFSPARRAFLLLESLIALTFFGTIVLLLIG
jgi:hypothetical protein